MDWRERVAGIYGARTMPSGLAGKPEFFPGAPLADISAAEACLGATLPASLRSLLLDTDGVMDMLSVDGGDWFESMWLLWPVREIVERNRRQRAMEREGPPRDFRRLVFFADAGCDGILFGFPVMEDDTCGPAVVAWRPVLDELEELAPSLDAFLEGWLTGSVSV